jgi:hypothetical protein
MVTRMNNEYGKPATTTKVGDGLGIPPKNGDVEDGKHGIG